MVKLNQGILIRIREKSGKNQEILFHIQNVNPDDKISLVEKVCIHNYIDLFFLD